MPSVPPPRARAWRRPLCVDVPCERQVRRDVGSSKDRVDEQDVEESPVAAAAALSFSSLLRARCCRGCLCRCAAVVPSAVGCLAITAPGLLAGGCRGDSHRGAAIGETLRVLVWLRHSASWGLGEVNRYHQAHGKRLALLSCSHSLSCEIHEPRS